MCIAFTLRPQDRCEGKGQLIQSQSLSRYNQGHSTQEERRGVKVKYMEQGARSFVIG